MIATPPVATPARVLAAVDLDGTLIYSARAVAAGVDRDAETDTAGLVCVEHWNGRPQSFVTARSIELLRALAAVAEVVPVTTRTTAQFSRIQFPGWRPHHAITTNGGARLRDGRPDRRWAGRVAGVAAAQPTSLDAVRAELQSRTSDWARGLRTADDLFCYLLVDPDRVPDDFVASWSAWCADRGWTVSGQRRKVYAVPQWLSKHAALARLRDELGATRVLAAGDSQLDAGMLAGADLAIRPAHGELAEHGWSLPGLTVTAASGVAAGEEILQLLLDATG